MPISLVTPFRFSVAFFAVVLGLSMTALFFIGCAGLTHEARKASEEPARELKTDEVPNVETVTCEGTLTDGQVLAIAKRVIEAGGGKPERLEDEFDLKVFKISECQYMLSGVQEWSTLHFSITMTASGEILSPPWCCIPGFKVDVSDLIAAPKEQSPKP